MPLEGLEPSHLKVTDPKSAVSTIPPQRPLLKIKNIRSGYGGFEPPTIGVTDQHSTTELITHLYLVYLL